MNFREQIRSVDELFGLRNRLYIRSRDGYFDYQLDIVRNLLKILRKEIQDPEVYSALLVSIFGWTSALAYSFGELPIVEAYCMKYPMNGCSYCGKKICVCRLDRISECRPANIDPRQLDWSVRKFMEHNDATYGESNRARGLQTSVMRLIEEMLEIKRTLLVDYSELELPAHKLKERIASEFADTFAWIFAVGNMCGPNKRSINLQAALESTYNGIHKSSCGQRPCVCGALDWVNASTIPTPS